MTLPDALKSFQDGFKNLMDVVYGYARCRDLLAEALTTLSLPANRAKIIAGDKHAIAMLFAYVDGVAGQFTALDGGPHASPNPPLASAPTTAPAG